LRAIVAADDFGSAWADTAVKASLIKSSAA
jgi:hypothetical protein